MNKITARDIQVFVAGALGLMGSNTLAQSIFVLFFSSSKNPNLILIVSLNLIAVIPLLLGLAIFFKSKNAVNMSKVILAVMIILDAVFVIGNFLTDNPKPLGTWMLNLIQELVWIILYCLLYFSNSKRFEEIKSLDQ